MNTVWTILIALLLFGLVIFLHEFGHFFTAKLFGIKVNEFALGMGPKLISFGKGETKYSLRLLPIGGFCAMEGEDEDSTDPRAFNRQKVWKRIIVVAAGAIMNLILGFFLLLALRAQADYFLSNTIHSVGDAVTYTDGASLEAGDKVVSINGFRIFCEFDMNYALSQYGGEPLDFVVKRGGQTVDVPGVKINFKQVTGKDNQYAFYIEELPKTVGSVITQAAKYTVSIGRIVWVSLIDLIRGRYGLDAVSGPVGTVEIIGEAASAGANFKESLNNLIWVMAMITVNLGIFNLLPIPALDGGRLLFLVIEAIRRKPVPPKYEGWVHAAGFVLLIGLMLVVTFNDVLKLFGK